MPKFEAHITAPKEHGQILQRVAERNSFDPNWVFTEISGCPLLGQGVYSYLSGYDTDGGSLQQRMSAISAECVRLGATILREKVERIVFDTRTGVDEIGLVKIGERYEA